MLGSRLIIFIDFAPEDYLSGSDDSVPAKVARIKPLLSIYLKMSQTQQVLSPSHARHETIHPCSYCSWQSHAKILPPSRAKRNPLSKLTSKPSSQQNPCPTSQDEQAPKFQEQQRQENKPFPLLSLPPELWINICRLAVDNATNSSPDTVEELNASQQACQQRKTQLPFLPLYETFDAEQNSLLAQPALTKTCRLLREELLPYFYTSSLAARGGMFDVELKEFHCDWVFRRMGSWVQAIGDRNRRCLSRVSVVSSVDKGEEMPERPTFAYLDEKEDQLAEFFGDVKYDFEEGELVEERGEKVAIRHRIVFR